jgi:N-acetylglucosamine kinase-like BadF-type ATPase
MMNNPIVAHINKFVNERVGAKTRAELIAAVLVEQALKGDTVAIRIVLDAMESYDPALAGCDDDEEDIDGR